MADVFISYNRQDRAIAERLRHAFELHALSVWYDKNLIVGRDFSNEIEKELKSAKCVVVIWTARSADSVWVKNEAHEGLERGILVPVSFENTRPPFDFRHLQTANLSTWQGEEGDPAILPVIAAIGALIGNTPHVPTAQPPPAIRNNNEPNAPAARKTPGKQFLPHQTANDISPGIVITVSAACLAALLLLAASRNIEFNGMRIAFPVMLNIPAGEFAMGSPPNEEGRGEDEGPQRQVSVKAFSMSKYEVTVREYVAFLNAAIQTNRPINHNWFDNSSEMRESQIVRSMSGGALRFSVREGRSDFPITLVSWEGAIAYAAWLSEELKASYRLPTEAEWEYAARSNSTTPYHFGSNIIQLCDFANVSDISRRSAHAGRMTAVPCDDTFPDLAPVGKRKPNGFGLHDMLGNVAEWVQDCWSKNYENAPTNGSAVLGDDRACHHRVLRGGSFIGLAPGVRSAVRYANDKNSRSVLIGFRVAKVDPGVSR